MMPSCSQGSSATAIVELAKRKHYELIAVTRFNLIFIVNEYFELFEIPDNALELLRDDSMCPQLFITYDGMIHLAHNGIRGSIVLPWHDLTLTEDKVQCLPTHLRAYPPTYTPSQMQQFELFWCAQHSAGRRTGE